MPFGPLGRPVSQESTLGPICSWPGSPWRQGCGFKGHWLVSRTQARLRLPLEGKACAGGHWSAGQTQTELGGRGQERLGQWRPGSGSPPRTSKPASVVGARALPRPGFLPKTVPSPASPGVAAASSAADWGGQRFPRELRPWEALGRTLWAELALSLALSFPICHVGGPSLSRRPVWLRKGPQVGGSVPMLRGCLGASPLPLRVQAEVRGRGSCHPAPCGLVRKPRLTSGSRAAAEGPRGGPRQPVAGSQTLCLPPDLKYCLWQVEGSAVRAGQRALASLLLSHRESATEASPPPHFVLPSGTGVGGTPLRQARVCRAEHA